MAGLHARLAPSSSKMWIACLASAIGDDRQGEDDETIYAKQGTAAHQVACLALTEGTDAADYVNTVAYGQPVTEEMCESVQEYVDLCRAEALYAQAPGVEVIYPLHPEDKISLEPLHPPEPVWGTTDCWLFKVHAKTLTVIDYKHGKWIVVDANENDQGRCYALGVLVKLILQDPELAKAVEWVEIVICQPRAFHPEGSPRRERISVEELISWYRNRLLPAIEGIAAAMRANFSTREQLEAGMFVAGEHCKFCRRAGRCTTRMNYELDHAGLLYAESEAKSAEVALTTLPPDPTYMTPEQLKRVIDAADGFRNWLSAVEKYALRSNLAIPGMKRVESYGHRAWKEGAAAVLPVLKLLFSMSEDEAAPRVVRSPTQIEKALPKSKREALKDFYHRPARGLILVNDDDKREAVEAEDLAQRLYAPVDN